MVKIMRLTQKKVSDILKVVNELVDVHGFAFQVRKRDDGKYNIFKKVNGLEYLQNYLEPYTLKETYVFLKATKQAIELTTVKTIDLLNK